MAAVPSHSPTPTTPLSASSPPFHSGEAGLTYAPVPLAVTGGAPPYRWSVVSGGLPDGLTLGADGKVSGSPTTAGIYSFTIQVADSGGSTASVPGTISIAEQLTASLLPACAQYCRVELGCDSTCGAFGQLAGGVGPYSYTVTQGPLPAGTSLSGLSLAGIFKGLSGWLQFSVRASDSLGATTDLSPKFWMYDHLVLSGGSIPATPNNPCFWTGSGCSGQFPYAGGTPSAGTPAVTAAWISHTCTTGTPPLPAITIGSGQITVSEPNGQGCSGGWTGKLSVVLTNQDPCSPGPASCTASAVIQITQLAS